MYVQYLHVLYAPWCSAAVTYMLLMYKSNIFLMGKSVCRDQFHNSTYVSWAKWSSRLRSISGPGDARARNFLRLSGENLEANVKFVSQFKAFADKEKYTTYVCIISDCIDSQTENNNDSDSWGSNTKRELLQRELVVVLLMSISLMTKKSRASRY